MLPKLLVFTMLTLGAGECSEGKERKAGTSAGEFESDASHQKKLSEGPLDSNCGNKAGGRSSRGDFNSSKKTGTGCPDGISTSPFSTQTGDTGSSSRRAQASGSSRPGAGKPDSLNTKRDSPLSGSQPLHTQFKGSETEAVPALKTQKKAGTILSVCSESEVIGEYIRVMDVVDFVKDPGGLEPFIGTIVVCPSPPMDDWLVVSRKKIEARLEEYNVPLEDVVFTGPSETMVIRAKPAAENKPEENTEGTSLNYPEAQFEPESWEVRKGERVKMVREGSFFCIEEWGSAQADGKAGDVIGVVNEKGDFCRGRIQEGGTIVPVKR